ncbi:MAG: methylenetetrahydrofolate reductase [Firmicutes bacterium]|nr:methylenetetrahydrofolate reductase [Bacillota bacterium]
MEGIIGDGKNQGPCRKLSFREAILDPDAFSVTWELVPGRGAWEESQQRVLTMAEKAAKDHRINGITITDNPGGKPAILACGLAVEAMKYGVDPIIHFTCKDKNRNDIESELYALARSGVENLLVMTGDYPSEGYMGGPKPVFDLDAVQALRLIARLNAGNDIPAYKGRMTLKATKFFPGAVVSPFKQTEAEVMTQYYKLHQKVKSGVRFIISQLGYDARKFDELLRYVRLNGFKVPVIGNIYVLTLGAARLMNRNAIPGCVVTDELLKILEEESSSGGFKGKQLLRSAKLYAVMKGLGFKGVNVSGQGLSYEDVVYIIENGEELSPRWEDFLPEFDFPQREGFYFFERGPVSPLNADRSVNRAGYESMNRRNSGNRSRRGRPISYWLLVLVHRLVFDPEAPFFPLAKGIARLIDRSSFKGAFTLLEYFIKTLTNECRFCGDCALHDLAYICPMSKCPKQQRNGPCGGSYEGWCEVYPGKQRCIYVAIYGRFKGAPQEKKLAGNYISPCNWQLYRTSSWLNYFCGRDYSGLRESLPEEGRVRDG